jgi:hypothetical protein
MVVSRVVGRRIAQLEDATASLCAPAVPAPLAVAEISLAPEVVVSAGLGALPVIGSSQVDPEQTIMPCSLC